MAHFTDILNRLIQNVEAEVDDEEIAEIMKADLFHLDWILKAVPSKTMDTVLGHFNALRVPKDSAVEIPPHQFTPVKVGSERCVECGLPRTNGVHNND